MQKDRLPNQASAILKYNLDLVYSKILVGGKKNIYYYPITEKAIRNPMLYGNLRPHPAIAIKAKILKKYKYKDLLEKFLGGLLRDYLANLLLQNNFLFKKRFVVFTEPFNKNKLSDPKKIWPIMIN